jgi:hypothetical protein
MHLILERVIDGDIGRMGNVAMLGCSMGGMARRRKMQQERREVGTNLVDEKDTHVTINR